MDAVLITTANHVHVDQVVISDRPQAGVIILNVAQAAERALEQGKGVLRLAPCWVPRLLSIPGRRLGLHPEDYYAFGAQRGPVVERWLASTTKADNGPPTLPDEGLSCLVLKDGRETRRVLLAEAIEAVGKDIIGERLMSKYGGWPVYSKFFDSKGALPHHLHLTQKHASRVSRLAKAEAYYFPPQMNNYEGNFPYTFFGLAPGTSPEQIIECLRNWDRGDNGITNLSRAYRLKTGTGWDVPPGLLHAPGSLCTYETQQASDVCAVFQSLIGGQAVPRQLLTKDVPPDKQDDLDYLVSLVDWDLNVDADLAKHRFMKPKPVRPVSEMQAEGYVERWIAYRSAAFSAKELTVLPARKVNISDSACYGLIVVQGHGRLGDWDLESPTLIRFGQLTADEFFVTEQAAREGVAIINSSKTDSLVMLKHFGPDNPDLEAPIDEEYSQEF